MAVLNKDEFFSRLNERMGTDTSEETISFIEDMTDTYNHLESAANGDGVNWEEKYNELDKSWREKYRHRFFSGGPTSPNQLGDFDEVEKEKEYEKAENIKIDDLFKED